MKRIAVIIVVYNSEEVIFDCLDKITGTKIYNFLDIIVVDGSSPDSAYLDEIEKRYPTVSLIRLTENLGFSRANNIGFKKASSDAPYILFLNPDAFITGGLLEELEKRMNSKEYEAVGACTPLLLGYSLDKNIPTGKIDSAGIESTWFGRFYDLGQGKVHQSEIQNSQSVLGICGAFMFCRRKALEEASLNGSVFNDNFFMYKEDIELSLRLRSFGWDLKLLPDLLAYHCRGWEGNRSHAQSWAIKHSLLNDWKVWKCNYGSLTRQISSFFYLTLKSFVVVCELLIRSFSQRNKK